MNQVGTRIVVGGTFTTMSNQGSSAVVHQPYLFACNAAGTNVLSTWVDYTGSDSLYSVAVTGTAIYVGGHRRWMNNANQVDFAGTGSVPRPGLAGLDPVNGMPLTWNPGRNPRGAGAG